MKSFKGYIAERCWPGYKSVPGKTPYSPGSCVKEEDETEEMFDLVEEMVMELAQLNNIDPIS